MRELFCRMLEFTVLFPGLLLAYLPMKHFLKHSYLKTAALMFPLSLLLCVIGGAVSFYFSIPSRWVILALAAVAGTVYLFTLKITLWKSVSVYLAVCAIYSCLGGVALAVNGVLYPQSTAPWMNTGAAGCFLFICCVCTALSWHPATHAVRTLLEDDAFAQTWYIFWIIPILFIGVNLFLIPRRPEVLHFGRVLKGYIVVSLILLLMLVLFYMLFFHMADSLNRNDRLRRKNHYLSMQRARYNYLCTAITETKQARHDMRHQLNAISALVNKQDWDGLTVYLSGAFENIPDAELTFCDHPAVDAVAGYYAELCRKNRIPYSFSFDLPAKVCVPEIDLCLVLSNLLENALEASLKIELSRRQIKAAAYLHTERMILLTVENTFEGEIKRKKGVFQSTKREGDGIGIQSVCRIAEKNGGYSSFCYENGVFCADVILRASDS